MGTEKKARLSIIPRDPYPTFQKIRGSSATLPSGQRQGLGGSNDVQQGWETEGKEKKREAEAWRSLRALRARVSPRTPIHPVFFDFSNGHLCRLPARLFSHNSLCGLQHPPLTACLNSQHVRVCLRTCTYRTGEIIRIEDKT